MDNKKWYLSKVGEWEQTTIKTPRTKEKISHFFDRELDAQFPILKPNENIKIRVYEYGNKTIWGEDLPILIIAYPYYALYYDPSMKRVFIFKGKRGISKSFTFAKNMAKRHN